MSLDGTLRISPRGLALLFDRLEEYGFEPRWYADHTGLIATCPCCGLRDGLVAELERPSGEVPS